MSNYPDDDVKDLATQYKQRLERQKLDQQTFLEEGKLLEAKAPKVWADLRDLIKRKRDAINTEMGSEVLSWDDVTANSMSMTRKHDGATLKGKFVSLSPIFSVAFECKKAKIDWQLGLEAQLGEVQFVYKNPTTLAVFMNTPEEIAYGLIRDFLTK
jgi:hypothetical protein